MENENAVISERILTLVQSGVPLRDALDAVLGAGSFAKLVDELYDALRAKAAGEVA